MRITRLALLAAPALMACAGAAGSTTATPSTVRTAREALPPCPEASEGATAEWRQVTGPGFRMCVPAAWEAFTPRDQSGTARGGWRLGRERSIAWNVGPRGAEGAAGPIPYNDRRESTISLGARQGRVVELSVAPMSTYLVSVPATATEPELRMTLYAQHEAARAEVLAALRTLKPAPVAAP